MTAYGVELELAIGVGRPDDVMVWNTDQWDLLTWGATDTDLGDWVDVTCQAADGVGLKAGADDGDGVVTRWEAQTLACTLVGEMFDPWSGPYAPLIGPMIPIRLRWRAPDLHRFAMLADPEGWVTAFTGYVDAAGYNWQPAPDPARSAARVTATDQTTLLATHTNVAQDPAGHGDTAAARVGRVLDNAGWPAAARDITPGGVALAPTELEDPPWDELLDVADTDLALMWTRRDGRLAYRPQGRIGAGVELGGSLVVCPDTDPATIQVQDMDRTQPDVIRNVVTIARGRLDTNDTPTPATRSDPASVDRYRERRYSRTDLLHLDDAWSVTVAQAVLSASAWTSTAPRSAVLDSRTGDPDIPALLLALEPSYVFDVTDPAGTIWRMGCVGWDVTITHAAITGRVALDDWSRWSGTGWNTQAAQWDLFDWSMGPIG